jgi:hypothetical protein
VVNRGLATKDHNKFKALLRKYDIKFIVDLDDWWNLPTDHVNKSLAKGTQILNSLKIADEIHTTNEYLAEKIQKINPYVPIYILPNAIDPRREQWTTDKTTEELSIGYLGALYHDYDLEWNEIDLSPYNSYSLQFYQQAIGATHAFAPRDYNNYGELYKQVDVSIAPLAPTEFNRCKSNLKALEAGFTKTCIIAQKMHPYTPLLNDSNSILCRTPSDWREALASITKEKAQELAENLYHDVQFFDIENINNTRQECFVK